MTDALQKLAALDKAASPGLCDCDGPAICAYCLSKDSARQKLAVLSHLLLPAFEALDGIATGLEADDHYCCHHARLGRDDHTEECYVGIARTVLAQLEEALK